MIPASLQSALGTRNPQLTQIRDVVHGRLNTELSELNVIATEVRPKADLSVYQKLQTGRYQSIDHLQDLIGAKVVVRRRGHIPRALEIVQATDFQEVDADIPPSVNPAEFRFREPKIYLRLPSSYLARHPELEKFAIEVQFTTALQHALDDATHDFDYKGSEYAWKNFRLVAQLRGTLELVDGILDNLDAASKLVDGAVTIPDSFKTGEAVVSQMASTFHEDVLPPDRRRMADTIAEYLRAADLAAHDLQPLLERHADLTQSLSLDPTAAAIGCIIREHHDALVANYPHRFCIPEELATQVDETAAVPADRRVTLT